MKNLLFLLLLATPLLAFAQQKNMFEFKAGPNLTLINDGRSNAGYGYGFALGMMRLSKNERFLWNVALMQTKTATSVRYSSGEGYTVSSNIPGSDDVDYFTHTRLAFYVSLPFGIRYFLKEGKHKFYLEHMVGPAVLAVEGSSHEYHYTTSPDYVLNYQTTTYPILLKVQTMAAFGWQTSLTKDADISISPNISCLFFDFSSQPFERHSSSTTVTLGLTGSIIFGK